MMIIVVTIATIAAKEGKFSRYDATGKSMYQVSNSMELINSIRVLKLSSTIQLS